MITSKDNEIIKKVSKLSSSAKFRKESGSFVAEGVRLCADGVISGADAELFLYTSKAAEKYPEEFTLLRKNVCSCYEISETLFRKISDTMSPQGFICVFRSAKKHEGDLLCRKGGIYTALERIQDPSNMGTILRTAEALGTDGIIVSSDCCDICSPKVVRGSMGAVFRVPVTEVEDMTSAVKKLTEQGIRTYASTPHEATDIDKVDFSQGGVIIIGNEGSGLKEETIKASTQSIRIPMRGRAESLNAAAAAAILMYAVNSR